MLGVYFLWTFATLYESIGDFIRQEITVTVFVVGLIIGGAGLWRKRQAGWIANQMTGIHFLLSALIGIIATSNTEFIQDEGTTSLILCVLILIVGARLFWTNRQQWLDQFGLSNKVRLMTISFGTIISLALVAIIFMEISKSFVQQSEGFNYIAKELGNNKTIHDQIGEIKHTAIGNSLSYNLE